MTTYDNFNRPAVLAYGDQVDFICAQEGVPEFRISYKVENTYLNDIHEESNQRIFEFLKVPDRATLAGECYGYPSTGGSWPSYRQGDFSAVLSLIHRLYDVMAGTAGKLNDSAARVNVVDNIGAGFSMVLDAVKCAGHRVTPLEIAEILVKNKVQGFDLEDVSEILYSLASDDLKVLTFHTDEAGQEVYFVDPEKKGFMEYIAAVKHGQNVTILPREHALVPHILKYLRLAPKSVTKDKLVEAFGSDGLGTILEDLCRRKLLKCWEKGYYTRPEGRDEVDMILAEANL